MNTATTQTGATMTMTIRGRTFTVEETKAANGEKQFIFTGKRGAVYGTMRNRTHADQMFLIDGRGFGLAKGFEGVWLSDATGSLVLVCS